MRKWEHREGPLRSCLRPTVHSRPTATTLCKIDISRRSRQKRGIMLYHKKEENWGEEEDCTWYSHWELLMQERKNRAGLLLHFASSSFLLSYLVRVYYWAPWLRITEAYHVLLAPCFSSFFFLQPPSPSSLITLLPPCSQRRRMSQRTTWTNNNKMEAKQSKVKYQSGTTFQPSD